ncbi:MAG: hemerythrin domain-containing protein, partial [Comamonas sp.]|nr:hemerythrin domain-containing protein [Comamonas sp.]
MQIDKLKHQHIDILRRVAALRTLTHSGVADNAQAIAEGIVGMSAVIKLHLAVEDQALYPSLQRGGDADLARLGRKYHAEMAPLAQAYDG